MERMRDPECFRAPLVERGPGCAGATDVGPQRVRNEDAYWIAEDAAALVVADGLGGLPAGDVASALAVAGAAGFLADALASSSRRGGSSSKRARHEDHRPEAGNGSPATPEARLGRLAHDAAVQAQRCVLEASRRRPELRGMATTLVVALVENRTAVILHIGDSRAVLWRAGQVVATTFDHNGVGDLLRSGALTPEQARRHPARNLVREVVGMPDGYQAECQTWTMEPGDTLVLCTDGVSDAIGEEAIARVLDSTSNAAAAAATLIAVAGIVSGNDNATAIVRCVT